MSQETNDRTISSVVVYASIHHGNSRRIATAISESIGADLLTVEEARSVSPDRYQLWGLGSGIYFGRHHRSLLQLVDSWNSGPAASFVFSSAGLSCLRYFQHSALRRRLQSKGSKILAEFCCRGWDTVGPLWLMGGINRRHPDSGDIERAKRFADHVLSLWRNTETPSVSPPVSRDFARR